MLRQIFFIVIALLPVGITGCLYERPQSYNNSEVVQFMEGQHTGEFTSIELEGNYLVKLENAEENSIEIHADEEMKELILVDISDGVLSVKTIDNNLFKNHRRAELIIKAPVIKFIEIKESASFVSDETFRFDHLEIKSAGALKMDISLSGNYFGGEMAGATDLNLRGDIEQVKLEIPGAGKVAAFDLHVADLDLSLAGAGKAEVYASQRLNVDVAGACSVTYKGSPEKVFTNVSGIGRVREAD